MDPMLSPKSLRFEGRSEFHRRFEGRTTGGNTNPFDYYIDSFASESDSYESDVPDEERIPLPKNKKRYLKSLIRGELHHWHHNIEEAELKNVGTWSDRVSEKLQKYFSTPLPPTCVQRREKTDEQGDEEERRSIDSGTSSLPLSFVETIFADTTEKKNKEEEKPTDNNRSHSHDKFVNTSGDKKKREKQLKDTNNQIINSDTLGIVQPSQALPTPTKDMHSAKKHRLSKDDTDSDDDSRKRSGDNHRKKKQKKMHDYLSVAEFEEGVTDRRLASKLARREQIVDIKDLMEKPITSDFPREETEDSEASTLFEEPFQSKSAKSGCSSQKMGNVSGNSGHGRHSLSPANTDGEDERSKLLKTPLKKSPVACLSRGGDSEVDSSDENGRLRKKSPAKKSPSTNLSRGNMTANDSESDSSDENDRLTNKSLAKKSPSANSSRGNMTANDSESDSSDENDRVTNKSPAKKSPSANLSRGNMTANDSEGDSSDENARLKNKSPAKKSPSANLSRGDNMTASNNEGDSSDENDGLKKKSPIKKSSTNLSRGNMTASDSEGDSSDKNDTLKHKSPKKQPVPTNLSSRRNDMDVGESDSSDKNRKRKNSPKKQITPKNVSSRENAMDFSNSDDSSEQDRNPTISIRGKDNHPKLNSPSKGSSRNDSNKTRMMKDRFSQDMFVQESSEEEVCDSLEVDSMKSPVKKMDKHLGLSASKLRKITEGSNASDKDGRGLMEAITPAKKQLAPPRTSETVPGTSNGRLVLKRAADKDSDESSQQLFKTPAVHKNKFHATSTPFQSQLTQNIDKSIDISAIETRKRDDEEEKMDSCSSEEEAAVHDRVSSFSKTVIPKILKNIEKKLSKGIKDEYFEQDLFYVEDLCDDDEIWIAHCPKSLALTSLVGKKLNLTGRTDLTSLTTDQSEVLNCESFAEQERTEQVVFCLQPSQSDRQVQINPLRLAGRISIEEKINIPSPNNLEVSTTMKLVMPENLRVRHPLLGAEFENQPKTSEYLDHGSPHKVKKKRSSRRMDIESESNLQSEEVDDVNSKVKKHKKKRKLSESYMTDCQEESNLQSEEESVHFKVKKHKKKRKLSDSYMTDCQEAINLASFEQTSDTNVQSKKEKKKKHKYAESAAEDSSRQRASYSSIEGMSDSNIESNTERKKKKKKHRNEEQSVTVNVQEGNIMCTQTDLSVDEDTLNTSVQKKEKKKKKKKKSVDPPDYQEDIPSEEVSEYSNKKKKKKKSKRQDEYSE